MEERIIRLPNGLDLEIQLTKKFLEIVRSHYSLSESEEVGDSYIRKYVYESMLSAVDKAESDIDQI
tara:strand:- start:1094 stop:1291 length:198 start_codon:yes stop_codon:yes gene_type:complete